MGTLILIPSRPVQRLTGKHSSSQPRLIFLPFRHWLDITIFQPARNPDRLDSRHTKHLNTQHISLIGSHACYGQWQEDTDYLTRGRRMNPALPNRPFCPAGSPQADGVVSTDHVP